MTKSQKRTTQKAYDKKMTRWDFILDIEGSEFMVEFYDNLYEQIAEQAAQSTRLYSTYSKPRKYNSWFCNK